MNQDKNENPQRFPNKNLGQDLQRDGLKNDANEDSRQASDANPLRDGSLPEEQGNRNGNSSIPVDEEDTLGIP
jgi:hypothetical protein